MTICSLISNCIGLTFLSLFTAPLLAQQGEKLDSTIVQVVFPQENLRLWYSSDDFRTDKFVVLPKYTLLYNKDLSTFRLLSNQGMLVRDSYKLLKIKSIEPHHVDDKRHAIGPIDPWFTILNDSTVLAGTAPFKGRKAVAGYVKIVNNQNKLHIEHIPFPIDEKADNIDANKTQFITNYLDFKGISVFASYVLLNKTDDDKYVVNGSVYVKWPQQPLTLLYDSPLIEKRRIDAVQILAVDDKLLIYDPLNEQVRIATTATDLATTTLIDLTKIIPPDLLSGKWSTRQFMYDRTAKQLYYRVLYFDKGVSEQLYMKVTLSGNSLTAKPIFRTGRAGSYGDYITNRRLFFYDREKGYIYVSKTELP